MTLRLITDSQTELTRVVQEVPAGLSFNRFFNDMANHEIATNGHIRYDQIEAIHYGRRRLKLTFGGALDNTLNNQGSVGAPNAAWARAVIEHLKPSELELTVLPGYGQEARRLCHLLGQWGGLQRHEVQAAHDQLTRNFKELLGPVRRPIGGPNEIVQYVNAHPGNWIVLYGSESFLLSSLINFEVSRAYAQQLAGDVDHWISGTARLVGEAPREFAVARYRSGGELFATDQFGRIDAPWVDMTPRMFSEFLKIMRPTRVVLDMEKLHPFQVREPVHCEQARARHLLSPLALVDIPPTLFSASRPEQSRTPAVQALVPAPHLSLSRFADAAGLCRVKLFGDVPDDEVRGALRPWNASGGGRQWTVRHARPSVLAAQLGAVLQVPAEVRRWESNSSLN